MTKSEEKTTYDGTGSGMSRRAKSSVTNTGDEYLYVACVNPLNDMFLSILLKMRNVKSSTNFDKTERISNCSCI